MSHKPIYTSGSAYPYYFSLTSDAEEREGFNKEETYKALANHNTVVRKLKRNLDYQNYFNTPT